MKKIIKNNTFKTIIFFTLLFTICSLFFLNIYISNNKVLIWNEDGINQHIVNLTSFRSYLINFFKTGSLDTFYWNIGNGMDLFSNYAFYITGDIFSYISVLFPVNKMSLLYSILFFVRLYFAGITFIIYCKHKKLNNLASTIGALMYVFSTFAIIGVFKHPYIANTMIIFPLVVLALERLIIEDKPILYSILIAIMIITNFYYAYMLLIIIAIYSIILIIYNYKNKGIKEILIRLFKLLIYSVVGVLISSFILLSVIYSYLNTEKITNNTIYPYSITYYRNIINNILNINDNGYWLYWGVQSIILLTLPKFYRNKKEETPYKILLPILLIPILISYVGYIFCGFNFPNNRWTLVFSFIFSYITAYTISKSNFDKKDYINTSILLVAFLLIDIILEIDINRLILFQLITLISISLVIKSKEVLENIFKKINLYKILFTSIFTIGIIYTIYSAHSINGSNYVSNSIDKKDYNDIIYNSNNTIKDFDESINYLYKNDKFDYYKVLKYPYNFNNLSMVLNYNSIGSYYSLTPKLYKEVSDDIKVSNYYISNGLQEFDYRTRITSLLGSKYIITNTKDKTPYGYELEKKINDENYIYKNENYISFASLYTKYINIDDYNKLSPLEKEVALLKAVALPDNIDKKELKENKNDFSEYIEKIDYKLIDDNKLIKDNKFDIYSETDNNSITIKTDKIKNKEIYINIKGLKHTGFTKKEMINNESGNSKISKNIAKNKYKWYEVNNYYKYTITIDDTVYTKEVEDNITSPYYIDNNDYLLNIGYYDKFNDEIKITFNTLGHYSFDSIEVYAVDMDDYEKDVKKLNNSIYRLNNYSNSYMSFDVNVKEDGILQLNTFYSDEFKIYVDGEEVESFKSNKYFIGIYITQGKHNIEITYRTKYLNEGIKLSLIGILLLLLLLIIHKPRGTNKKSLLMRFWNWGWSIYYKNEEIWNYLIVGGLTTIVSLGTYYICVCTFLNPNNGIQLQIANIISWILAVVFAYITNRIFVFKSKEKNIKKEATSFIGSRITTLLIDMLLMFIFVTLLHINDKLTKVFVQIIVVIANYIISKFFVFKNN